VNENGPDDQQVEMEMEMEDDDDDGGLVIENCDDVN